MLRIKASESILLVPEGPLGARYQQIYQQLREMPKLGNETS